MLVVLLGHFEPSVHGCAVGIFFAIGGIGWTVIPLLMGAYADRTSIQRGFLVAIGSAIGLCAVATVLLFERPADRKPTSMSMSVPDRPIAVRGDYVSPHSCALKGAEVAGCDRLRTSSSAQLTKFCDGSFPEAGTPITRTPTTSTGSTWVMNME